MVSGSCLCGRCTVNITQDPALKVLCHCNDCRHVSGSTNSLNVLIPDAGFSVTSGSETLKNYEKDTDKGNRIKSFFCSECGNTLWRESTGAQFKGMKIVNEGALETLTTEKPGVELYCERRAPWLEKIEGADQKLAKDS